MSRRCWTELNSFSVYVSISVVHFWFICHSLSTIACFEHLFIISSHLLSSPFLSSPSFSIFCRCINNLNCIWIKPFIKLGQQRPLLFIIDKLQAEEKPPFYSLNKKTTSCLGKCFIGKLWYDINNVNQHIESTQHIKDIFIFTFFIAKTEKL